MRKFVKPLQFAAVLLVMTSCAHVWVTQRDSSGGVIAYKGDPSGSGFRGKYEEAARTICGGNSYQVVNQQMRSSTGQYTYMQAQQQTANVYNNNGQQVGTVQNQTYTPVTMPYVDTWWEDTIQCKTTVPANVLDCKPPLRCP